MPVFHLGILVEVVAHYDPSWCASEASGSGHKDLGPATHEEMQVEFLASGCGFCLGYGNCLGWGHLHNEPVDGRSVHLSPSLCLANKYIFSYIFFKKPEPGCLLQGLTGLKMSSIVLSSGGLARERFFCRFLSTPVSSSCLRSLSSYWLLVSLLVVILHSLLCGPLHCPSQWWPISSSNTSHPLQFSRDPSFLSVSTEVDQTHPR